ncbi:hypothetical protein [Zobellella sp. DQSA1]
MGLRVPEEEYALADVLYLFKNQQKLVTKSQAGSWKLEAGSWKLEEIRLS